MRERKGNRRNHSIQEILYLIGNWILDHLRIVMPVVLAVCVLITVLVAVYANREASAREQEQTQEASAAGTTALEEAQIPLELNAYPDVCSLIIEYYTALANGDSDRVAEMNANMDETEKIRIQEIGQYIDSYTTVDVYTKPGPVDGSYVCYAYTKVKFKDYGQEVPGMQTMYVCTDENGSLYINEGEESEEVTDYIQKVSLQDDVVDLNNKVTAEYNDLLASDPDLQIFLDDLTTQLDVSVGEALAAANGQAVGEGATDAASEADTAESASQEQTDESAAQETSGEAAESADSASQAQYLVANEVVNVRSSDSETADRIGQTEAGAVYPLLESKENGWSRIDFDGTEAYVKTEFFTATDDASGTGDAAETDTQAQESETQSTEQTAASNADEVINPTKATALTTVTVRRSEGESAERLGTVYQGETLDVQMKMADGWTRVTFNGETGYVKSEYFEFQ
ncbi:MAG: SH3 domain-containing protein [Eubacteriales bacterium]|nr:SH3 domain-containing protein [Eubacteriales bacterium]